MSVSIKQKCLCLITTLTCVFMVYISLCSAKRDRDILNVYRKAEIIEDLPKKNDTEKYLVAMEKLVNFTENYTRYVNLNYFFGLMLTEVNLRKHYLMKAFALPHELEVRFSTLLAKNKAAIIEFKKMLERYETTGMERELRVVALHLVSGENFWSQYLEKFHRNLLDETTFYTHDELLEVYGKFDDYIERLEKNNYDLNPEAYDKCTSEMIRLERNPSLGVRRCNVSDSCVDVMIKGADYGYSVTRRLIYFTLARHGQSCSIVSEKRDREYKNLFCSKMYNELEYIVENDYLLFDLALEHIGLCGFSGHEQFLRVTWMDNFLRYQKDFGCFGPPIPTSDEPLAVVYANEDPQFNLGNSNYILGRRCNTHSTGVGASALSVFLRYILEKFY